MRHRRFRLTDGDRDFNPRTPLQSATKKTFYIVPQEVISIHALHYRVRRFFGRHQRLAAAISIHALHYRVRPVFASDDPWRRNFNPRTPLQSATPGLIGPAMLIPISIHALHYRVRPWLDGAVRQPLNFNPRTPLQSATVAWVAADLVAGISIHALHYRVRRPYIAIMLYWCGISIHALHYRVRPCYNYIISCLSLFQSTHSITKCDDGDPELASNQITISIHALHYRVRPFAPEQIRLLLPIFQSTHSITECDHRQSLRLVAQGHFNPRTPLQSATATRSAKGRGWIISIHALHYRVRHAYLSKSYDLYRISIHALHYRVRPNDAVRVPSNQGNFNPRTPLQSATVTYVLFVV